MNNNSYTEFMQLVNNRYSCRKYADTPLDRNDIEEVLNAARLAPSACNKQPWKFAVITTPEKRAIIHECYSREWIKNIPVFIIALGHHSTAWHRPDDNKDHTDVDLSIAIEHICLAAAAKGLGTCWICNFDVEKFSKSFDFGDGYEPIAIIPIGLPESQDIPKKTRKELDEIVIWE